MGSSLLPRPRYNEHLFRYRDTSVPLYEVANFEWKLHFFIPL